MSINFNTNIYSISELNLFNNKYVSKQILKLSFCA